MTCDQAKKTFYDDGWNAKMEACAAKTCGCLAGVCDVDDIMSDPREVILVDLPEDLPFPD